MLFIIYFNICDEHSIDNYIFMLLLNLKLKSKSKDCYEKCSFQLLTVILIDEWQIIEIYLLM